ncbi:MAG TPA: proline racemase family protein [Steroidobacteraceae bacterium]|nr:proline racemase family protein [Steroidobacteraceae bacterium]
MQRIRVVDSHTGGEPTRVVLDGGPVLTGSFAARVATLEREHEGFRAALCTEPRGSDVLVAALLTPPVDPTAVAGVIFFNDVSYLGMCGHGTIGLVTTLAWLGRLTPGRHRIETPAGVVTAELHASGRVSVRNVPAFRHATGVAVAVPGHGRITGDVAFGGNWFFLSADHGQRLEAANVERLLDFCWRIRQALEASGVTGAGGAVVDHIELTGPGSRADIDGRNFVLCPGSAYDRSPCGTGTSAKLACLAGDGKLRPGQVWRQESIIGSVFEARIELENGAIVPTITGEAFVTAEATLLLDPLDPYRHGIRARR